MDQYATSATSIGWRLELFSALFIPLLVVAVVLRFYARWLVVGTEAALEDALVIVSLVSQLALAAVGIGKFASEFAVGEATYQDTSQCLPRRRGSSPPISGRARPSKSLHLGQVSGHSRDSVLRRRQPPQVGSLRSLSKTLSSARCAGHDLCACWNSSGRINHQRNNLARGVLTLRSEL
jgi:hypothetical protein